VSLSSAGSGGSAYSILGIGDLRYVPGTRAAGMGYAGLALPVPDVINAVSPAAWSHINRTRLEASLLYEGFNSTDGTKNRYLSRADFNGAMLAIPVSEEHGITVVGGFLPYSAVNYDTFTEGTFSGSGESFSYLIRHQGRGGIGKGRLGLSYAPFPRLSLGLAGDYLFGTIENIETLRPTTESFSGGTSTALTTLNGPTLTFGALVTDFGGISQSLEPLSLGLFLTSGGSISTTRRTHYEYTSERDTSSESAGELEIPLTFGIGAGYRLGERILVAADYVTQPWSNAREDGFPLVGVRNATRLNIGAERLPNRNPAASWLDRSSYRLGFSWNATYYELNGVAIDEWVVTGGATFPLTGEARLAFAVEYGRRGTTDKNLIRDSILRCTVALTISELWFVRAEED
jgi:hypothetical protein